MLSGTMAELRRFTFRVGILGLCLGLFGCDHATKIIAERALAHGRAVTLAPGVLELRYTQNHDVGFSLLRALHLTRSSGVVLPLAIGALVAIVAQWIRASRRAGALQHVGFALIVAGALGNIVDRTARGYVVDFIHVTHWPVFNVADVAVGLGAFALAVASRAWRSTAEQKQ